MNQRPDARRGFLRALAAALVALAAGSAGAANDCLEPLGAIPRWSCRADLADGQVVDYCLEHTNSFGADPASRFFKMIATGPYASSCSCRAKGKLPGAAFGEDKTYLCLYPDTDAVVSGKITKRRIAGQTFSAAYNLRTTFSCAPDPACDVTPVVDRDLPARSGFVDLLPDAAIFVQATAGGSVDIGYLAGCGGYASEAPNAVFGVEPGPPGDVEFTLLGGDANQPGAPVLLILTPSGAAHCVKYTLSLPPEPGSYGIWIATPTAGAAVGVSVRGAYDAE